MGGVKPLAPPLKNSWKYHENENPKSAKYAIVQNVGIVNRIQHLRINLLSSIMKLYWFLNTYNRHFWKNEEILTKIVKKQNCCWENLLLIWCRQIFYQFQISWKCRQKIIFTLFSDLGETFPTLDSCCPSLNRASLNFPEFEMTYDSKLVSSK